MAQPKPKSSLPKIVIGSVILLGIVWIATGSNDTSKTTAASTTKKKTTSSNNSLYLASDYNITYAPPTEGVADKFVPLVFKATNGSGQPGHIDTSKLTIPPDLAGGESNWAFTGTVSVDGKWSALVENGTSAQSSYLKPGEKWKTSSVEKVTENLLILRDLSGMDREIPMQADIQASIAQQQADLADLRASASGARRNPNMPNAPYNPLMGPIGDAAIQQDGSMAAAASAATDQGNNSYGRNNRRNRGGGGGGGGGGRGGGRGGRGGGGGGFGFGG